MIKIPLLMWDFNYSGENMQFVSIDEWQRGDLGSVGYFVVAFFTLKLLRFRVQLSYEY